jgi:hypothetical protein
VLKKPVAVIARRAQTGVAIQTLVIPLIFWIASLRSQ